MIKNLLVLSRNEIRHFPNFPTFALELLPRTSTSQILPLCPLSSAICSHVSAFQIINSPSSPPVTRILPSSLKQQHLHLFLVFSLRSSFPLRSEMIANLSSETDALSSPSREAAHPNTPPLCPFKYLLFPKSPSDISKEEKN